MFYMIFKYILRHINVMWVASFYRGKKNVSKRLFEVKKFLRKGLGIYRGF